MLGPTLGQSAISIAAVNKNLNIISLEPNPPCEALLNFVSQLLGQRFEYHMSGAGSRHEVQTLYIPCKKRHGILAGGHFCKRHA